MPDNRPPAHPYPRAPSVAVPRTPGTNLTRHAANTPDAVALVDIDGACTYSRLDALVDIAAARLATLGVRPGHRVATLAEKRVSTVACLLASMRLGAIAVPINPRLLRDQVRHVLRDSGASVIAGAGRALEPMLADDATNVLAKLDTSALADGVDVAQLAPTRLPVPHAGSIAPSCAGQVGDGPATILYTSGSTAEPKGVVLSAANLAYGADSVATFLDLTATDRILALMPLSFDYGLNQVLSALHVGATAVLFDVALPRDVVGAVVEHDISGLPAVPHLWNRLARLDWPAVSHLRYATNTGGALPAETSSRLRQRLPHVRFHAMYGFTEGFRATSLAPGRLAERPDSVGTAVPHARTLVVGTHGAEVGPGETGELIQSGPLVTLGYWNAPEATAARFRRRPAPNDDGVDYAWSGDLFRRDEEGLLYFVSRRDDVAKLHGYRVNPAEIERALVTHPGVGDACVVCVPHPILGEAAVAIVAADTGALDGLAMHVKRILPTFMRPERTFAMDVLPTGPHGKVDRRALRDTHLHLFDGVEAANRSG